MPFTQTASDVTAIWGDSVTGGFSGSIFWTAGYEPPVRQRQIGTIVPPSRSTGGPLTSGQRWTRYYANGAANRTAVSASGDGIATAFLNSAGFRPLTKFIYQLGINDAFAIFGSTETINQFNTANAANLAAIQAAYPTVQQILLIGPWAHGLPVDIATQIAACVAGMLATVAATPNTFFCDWSGISNVGNTVGDGTHPNAAGAVVLGAGALAVTTVVPP